MTQLYTWLIYHESTPLSSKTLILLDLSGGRQKLAKVAPFSSFFCVSADSKGFSMPQIFLDHLPQHASNSMGVKPIDRSFSVEPMRHGSVSHLPFFSRSYFL